MNIVFKKIFPLFIFLCFLTANSSPKIAIQEVKGTYTVDSIKQERGYFIVKLKKSSPTKKDKMLIIELNHPNETFFSESRTLDLFAETISKNDNEVEAIRIVINRGKGQNRIFIPSRRMKELDFGESFLKMHGTENDYRVL